MAQELDGKVAIITGGARGIGRATVDRYVEEGARVVIADVNDELGEQAAAELGSAVRYKRTDVSKQADVDALVAFALAEFGGLDVMMNNAGVTDNNFGPLVDADFGNFQRITEVNLLGVFLGAQAAARHMAKHGGGSIINVASIAGTRPGHGLWTYRAIKAGVCNFTQSAAMDLGPDLIRVNCICPGNIPTDMGSYAHPEPGMTMEDTLLIRDSINAARMRRQALQRQGTVVDIANGAVFLGSDRSAQVTGLIMPIDGGATAGDPISQIAEILDARKSALAEIAAKKG
jgi:NAD(P)-dependent dehydrogenase (short-subunit alcohol dehydrogenase family)